MKPHILLLAVLIGCTSVPEKKAVVDDGFIKGVVEAIQPGKDGYTAKIMTAEKQTYFVTISHSNLADPAQYRSAKPGDTLFVKGEAFSMNDEKHLTVRELKK